MEIIDADGHINDHACGEEIANYMPGGNQMAKLFPEFDHLHFRYLKQNRRATGNPTAQDWNEFLDKTEISWTVLYPTAGLAVGRIMAPDWAVIACKAYNTWLYEKFLSRNPRLKGMALLPFQDIDSAAAELRRCRNELGMLGGMLPSNGEAIQGHLGNKNYWPLYDEAEKLGCCLAVHVGCLHHMGLDSFSTYYPAHALGHPFSLMIQAAAMLAHGVFDRFPKLRVAFLEGGATWVPFMMDRLDRSYHAGHVQLNVNGELLGGPKQGEKASEYFRSQMREGRIFVGFDCDDDGLSTAVAKAGRRSFLFGSDYPHEVFDAAKCRHEIDELLGRDDLTQDDKQAVLGENALRFYRPGL
ncbi:MAG TPA: amidohydrolase family protein [Candidatus Binatia bacterium]|nr:amidohydrolase family protein [Candidatus Binatia bacterium]